MTDIGRPLKFSSEWGQINVKHPTCSDRKKDIAVEYVA